jgi:hypothetical protein
MVQDYTVPRNGYQTAARVRYGEPATGGTEEARDLATKLWQALNG